MQYFSLLTREDKQSPWGVAFGNYDRECVVDERHDSYAEYTNANVKIIRTADDQASIDAKVAELNAK